MSLAFKVFALSDIGLVREGNEDSGLISSKLVAVADGMGGHAGGEVASTIAITALTAKQIDEDSLLTVTKEIDIAILDRSNSQPELAGMGTTLTSLLLRGESVALLHIGDSRAYRLRGSSFDQLSVDHTVIQELLNQGAISESDIATHPQRSVLTQVLMGEGNIEVPLPVIDVKLGDRFLICSDGLSSVLTEKEIKSLLKGKDRDAAVAALVDATYINGAPDNVTLVIADIVEEKQPDTFETIGAAG